MKNRNHKGMFYTIGIVLLIIPLILLVAYYATTEKTKKEDTISKLRCDELHYFVEDIREDLGRANVIFGRRAAIYASDKVVTSGTPLLDYTFNCSSNCRVNCTTLGFNVNGSEAAIAELTLCGTLHGSNVTYMVNHTLSQWLDRINMHGEDMNFNTTVRLKSISVIPRDAWGFNIVLNTTFSVFDQSKTCYYTGDSVVIESYTSILGLEDPLYPLNTNSYVIKYIDNCTEPLELNSMVAGCSKNGLGEGIATGSVIFQANISDLGAYCSGQQPDVINNQILVLDGGFGGCNRYEETVCFNASDEHHFAGVIDYGPNSVQSLVVKCKISIPWISLTCKMDNETWTGHAPGPGCDRPSGCNETYIRDGWCITIENKDNPCGNYRSRVLTGISSESINTTCYRISNASLYTGRIADDGASFFDRLDGSYNLSEKYVNQSLTYFNNTLIGLETMVSPYNLDWFGMPVKDDATWVDYLYWQNVSGCKVAGACAYNKHNLRLDNLHATILQSDTECINASTCPTGNERCVNCIDEDADALWDWEDPNCKSYFTGCGEVHYCDPEENSDCETCDSPMPPEISSTQTCGYYAFNSTEWHFYRYTANQTGKLTISFSGDSSAHSAEKTDMVVYNYSLDGNSCNNHAVTADLEHDEDMEYCVIEGQVYVIGLDVDVSDCGANGTYTLETDLSTSDPMCTTTTSTTTTTTNALPTTTSTTTTTTTSTTTTTTLACVGFQDNMEAGNNGWNHGGAEDEWARGNPQWWGISAHSGSSVWATDLSIGGSYNNDANERLNSTRIDLTYATSPRLNFWEYRRLRSSDYCYVEISQNNQDWNTLVTYEGNLDEWTERSLNLNLYKGGAVWIRFRLASNWRNTARGWAIDDVNVTCY